MAEKNLENNAPDSDSLMKDGIYQGNKGPRFGCRHVQILLTAVGGAAQIITNALFSTAIVAMTTKGSSSNPNVKVYDWDNVSIILSGSLWGGMVSQLFAGYFAHRFGPKWIIFVSSVLNCIAFVLIPIAAELSSGAVIALRIMQGAAQGVCMVINQTVSGLWVPLEERSTMGFLGTACINIALSSFSVITGKIAASDLGWPWIFYIFSILGFVWCGIWLVFGQQGPESHPRITPEEKKYLQVALGKRQIKHIEPPWKKIFLNIHFWAIICAMIGFNFAVTFITTEMSIYLSKVMQFDIEEVANVGTVPALAGLFSGIILAPVSDFLINKQIIRVVNARRLFQSFGIISISTALILLTYLPPRSIAWTFVILCFANAGMFSVFGCGAMVNVLDLSPPFAGLIFAFGNTAAQGVGMFVPLLVQWFISDLESQSEWRTIFIVSAAVAIGSTVFFNIFVTDKRQNWEGPGEPKLPPNLKEKRGSIFSIKSNVTFNSPLV